MGPLNSKPDSQVQWQVPRTIFPFSKSNRKSILITLALIRLFETFTNDPPQTIIDRHVFMTSDRVRFWLQVCSSGCFFLHSSTQEIENGSWERIGDKTKGFETQLQHLKFRKTWKLRIRGVQGSETMFSSSQLERESGFDQSGGVTTFWNLENDPRSRFHEQQNQCMIV